MQRPVKCELRPKLHTKRLDLLSKAMRVTFHKRTLSLYHTMLALPIINFKPKAYINGEKITDRKFSVSQTVALKLAHYTKNRTKINENG